MAVNLVFAHHCQAQQVLK